MEIRLVIQERGCREQVHCLCLFNIAIREKLREKSEICEEGVSSTTGFAN